MRQRNSYGVADVVRKKSSACVAEPLIVWVVSGSALVEEREFGGEWSGRLVVDDVGRSGDCQPHVEFRDPLFSEGVD